MNLSRIVSGTCSLLTAACGVEGTVNLQNPNNPLLVPRKFGAYTVREGYEGVFNVNGENFTISKVGQDYVLSDGSRLVFWGGLVQFYAGGLAGTKFSLEGACPSSDKVIQPLIVRDTNKGSFTVDSESFSLNKGETNELSDGSKITYLEGLSQDFAGGLHGAKLDLECH